MPPESAPIPSPFEFSIVEEFNVRTPFTITFRLDDLDHVRGQAEAVT